MVGRDTNGTPVVRYGFTLKQWFVNGGSWDGYYPSALSWCNSIGYRVPKVKDLTNASCQPGSYYDSTCQGSVGATPSSPNNVYMRHIGSGFVTEWGRLGDYSGVGFGGNWYWTSDPNQSGSNQFIVNMHNGTVHWYYYHYHVLCAYP
ncbi:hypothetical protein [Gilliamella sp. B3372]|uniref:hypothetical protein n=1 Tax=Gilliamella sp. B3372 TaxID=2817990 RepID=UPI00226A6EAE|nr:hypothetical protein [Gilliamella sp. B3372]MCX8584071.1 hypothetical protein [Gilliamella sp. B3372]